METGKVFPNRCQVRNRRLVAALAETALALATAFIFGLARFGRRVPKVPVNLGTSFHVACDEQWERDFENLHDAREWAKEISREGRMTWVVERWEGNPQQGIPPGCRLRTAFPEERREEAMRMWSESKAFPPAPRSQSELSLPDAR